MAWTAARSREGFSVPWTNNTGATISLGEVVEVGDIMGVLIQGATSIATTLANAAIGEVAIDNVYKVPKTAGQVWRAGDAVRWDATNKKGNRFGFGVFRLLGVAGADAAEADTVGYVKLNAQPLNHGTTVVFHDDFIGQTAPGASVVDGPWAKADTSAAGAPTLVTLDGESGGAIKALLANTDEVENLCLYHGDKLTVDIDQDPVFEARFYMGGAAANQGFVFGLGSARADDPDAVAANLWFRQDAASLNLLVETDDGVTDDDDNDTTVDLVADTYVNVAIDARDKTDVHFFVDGVRVLSATTFSFAGYAGKMQPILQLQKASGAGVGYVVVDFVRYTVSRT